MRRVLRSQITEAVYNPRVIDAHARKRLTDSLKRSGLVMPLVWNRGTGNLVAGHQRLRILDQLENGKDYALDVACVAVSLKEERELNVFLNNTTAMGNWDLDALDTLLKMPDFDLQASGFDVQDLSLIFDDDRHAGVFDSKNDDTGADQEMLEEMKRKRKEAKVASMALDDAEFYVVAVFQDRKQVDDFLSLIGQSRDSRYINGQVLAAELRSRRAQASPAPETDGPADEDSATPSIQDLLRTETEAESPG